MRDPRLSPKRGDRLRLGDRTYTVLGWDAGGLVVDIDPPLLGTRGRTYREQQWRDEMIGAEVLRPNDRRSTVVP